MINSSATSNEKDFFRDHKTFIDCHLIQILCFAKPLRSLPNTNRLANIIKVCEKNFHFQILLSHPTVTLFIFIRWMRYRQLRNQISSLTLSYIDAVQQLIQWYTQRFLSDSDESLVDKRKMSKEELRKTREAIKTKKQHVSERFVDEIFKLSNRDLKWRFFYVHKVSDANLSWIFKQLSFHFTGNSL